MSKIAPHAVRTDCVPCAACGGGGSVPLVPSLQQTLDEIRRHVWTTSVHLARELRVASNAMCNRLAYLRARGLIRRCGKEGKAWRWEACDRRRGR